MNVFVGGGVKISAITCLHLRYYLKGKYHRDGVTVDRLSHESPMSQISMVIVIPTISMSDT